ncbi:ABC-2 transporter permease [Bacillus bingmayongensis]|uniref:ABC-2 transporter permease n=1 Tax=Bacillus bingmayongensis TaxID=1150157 RepID=UPI000313345D|nr:ABC-2 transporter permease [Bacillus bingmayongensis]
MGQLILKDIFLQRHMFILYFVTSVLIFVSMAPEQNGFVISCMTLGVMGISVSMYIEERNQSESVLISLPLLRRDIVIAKYISTLIFLSVSIAITYFIVLCVGQLNNWKEGFSNRFL